MAQLPKVKDRKSKHFMKNITSQQIVGQTRVFNIVTTTNIGEGKMNQTTSTSLKNGPCAKILPLAEDLSNCTQEVLEAAPHKVAAVWPPTTHYEDYQN